MRRQSTSEWVILFLYSIAGSSLSYLTYSESIECKNMKYENNYGGDLSAVLARHHSHNWSNQTQKRTKKNLKPALDIVHISFPVDLFYRLTYWRNILEWSHISSNQYSSTSLTMVFFFAKSPHDAKRITKYEPYWSIIYKAMMFFG